MMGTNRFSSSSPGRVRNRRRSCSKRAAQVGLRIDTRATTHRKNRAAGRQLFADRFVQAEQVIEGERSATGSSNVVNDEAMRIQRSTA